MRVSKTVLLIILLSLVPVGSSLAHGAEPYPAPDPTEYSPRCERQAFHVVGTGFRPVPRNSLTRFRIISVLGFMDRVCAPRYAKMAIFDRRAGTNRPIQASKWTKWTTKRRFVRTVRTRPYRCGFYRAVYVAVAFYDVVRIHTERGARGC